MTQECDRPRKSEHRTGSQLRTVNSWARPGFHQMRKSSPGMIVERVVFTAEEHLEAQRQIERRAGELWCAGGCRRGAALNDWLQAEREVLEQFIWAYARGHALRQSSRPGASVRIARKKPEARIMKRKRIVQAREPQSTSARR